MAISNASSQETSRIHHTASSFTEPLSLKTGHVGRIQTLPKVLFAKRFGTSASPSQPSFAALSSPAAPLMHNGYGVNESRNNSTNARVKTNTHGSLFGTGVEVYAAVTSASSGKLHINGNNTSALPPLPSKAPPTLKKRHDYELEKVRLCTELALECSHIDQAAPFFVLFLACFPIACNAPASKNTNAPALNVQPDTSSFAEKNALNTK